MNKQVEQLLIGSMLGDGCIVKTAKPTHNNSLSIAHSEKQKEYCEFKYSILNNIGEAGKFRYNKIYHSRYKKGYVEEYRFKSRANKYWTMYRNLFYPQGKRVIHKKTIKKIEPLGLAIWFFDDAHRTRSGYQINTQRFTKNEVQWLRKLLKSKFDLNTTYQPFDNIIYIKKSSVQKLHQIIKPYILPCLEYKLLGESCINYVNCWEAKSKDMPISSQASLGREEGSETSEYVLEQDMNHHERITT